MVIYCIWHEWICSHVVLSTSRSVWLFFNSVVRLMIICPVMKLPFHSWKILALSQRNSGAIWKMINIHRIEIFGLNMLNIIERLPRNGFVDISVQGCSARCSVLTEDNNLKVRWCEIHWLVVRPKLDFPLQISGMEVVLHWPYTSQQKCSITHKICVHPMNRSIWTLLPDAR